MRGICAGKPPARLSLAEAQAQSVETCNHRLWDCDQTPLFSECCRTVKPTDDELINAYAGGTVAAFDALYTRYQQRMYNYCYRALGYDDGLAADLCQEIWMRVIKAAGNYNSNGRFDRWLFSLAHNCLVDRYRANATDSVHTAQDIATQDIAAIDSFVARFEACDNLELALQALPPVQRSALLLHYSEGYSLAEIATLEDTSTETIKSRVRYGINKLRRWMGDDDA